MSYIVTPGIDRIPPCAIEIEAAVIGTCIIYPDVIHDLRLIPEMFYKDSHRKIYDAILTISKRGGVDIVTLSDFLQSKGLLDSIGGPLALSRITNNIVSSHMIEIHAMIIKEKYIKREYIRVSNDLQNKAYDNLLPLDELIDYSESELFKLSDITQVRDIEKLSKIIDDQLVEIQKIINKEKKLTGVPSGYLNIDRVTGGWQEEDLVIIASRPSMGKTSLALSLSVNSATLKYPVGLFSLEMSKKQLATRYLSTASNYSNVQIRNAEINFDLLVEKSNDIAELPIWIDDTPAITIYELRSKVKKMILRNEIKIVIVDYLQLMRSNGETREQEISKISQGLKLIAKEFHVPVIALSQLNRKCEERKDKRPMLSDLRESGSIEQDADVVGLLWRPAYYGINTVTVEGSEISSSGVLFVDIAKNRNGATGDYVLYHNEALTRIQDTQIELQNLPY